MEEIKDILSGTDISAIISKLKTGRLSPLPEVSKLKKEWDPREHRTIKDKRYLPDRVVQKVGDDGQPQKDTQGVNRLALPLQQTIVNKAVSFAFGNPVKLNATPGNADQELILTGVSRLGHECKLVSFNKKIERERCRSTEAAEVWYMLDADQNEVLGFQTNKKVRVSAFAPFRGDELYPFFDITGDLVAFARQFVRVDISDKETTYFEVYTDTIYRRYVQKGGQWEQDGEDNEHGIGKIPVVYGTQEVVEWAYVQISIERLEYLLSKFAETNDYHASPKIFVTGEIKGFAQKGESGAILEGDVGSKAEYLSWDHAPESVKLEIDTLIRFIYSQTQTPDISFESVKGINSISGVALKMLFLDAHLKVEEKREILDEYLQRRVNIQKRIIGILSGKTAAAEQLQIEPEIVPYFIDDDATTINNLMTATGGRPIMSQKTAIKRLGWVEDVDQELKQIEEEESAGSISDVFNPSE